MIRIGEIVKNDLNPLMKVSSDYEKIVKQLSSKKYSSKEEDFLACLVISQTEKQYKKYLIEVMENLSELPLQKLIDDWQNFNFEINDKGLEDLLDESLFNDSLNNAFYHTFKRGTLYIRRLIVQFKNNEKDLNDFQKLVLHFVAAQLLHSWESSCIHLGLMLLNDWKIEDISKWFIKIWPIYKV